MHVKMADLIVFFFSFFFFPQEDEECRITTAYFKLVLEINKTDVH